MENIKSKLDQLFWKYEEKACYTDKMNLVGGFSDYVEGLDDFYLGELCDLDPEDPDFDIEILTIRAAVNDGCDKWMNINF